MKFKFKEFKLNGNFLYLRITTLGENKEKIKIEERVLFLPCTF